MQLGVNAWVWLALLDTFHMNIEEKSLGDAIRAVGHRLGHLHACENDRGRRAVDTSPGTMSRGPCVTSTTTARW